MHWTICPFLITICINYRRFPVLCPTQKTSIIMLFVTEVQVQVVSTLRTLGFFSNSWEGKNESGKLLFRYLGRRMFAEYPSLSCIEDLLPSFGIGTAQFGKNHHGPTNRIPITVLFNRQCSLPFTNGSGELTVSTSFYLQISNTWV